MTKTRLALLSTLADMHTQPIQYNLTALADILTQVAPDLLYVEVPQRDWELGRLDQAPVEVQRSLLPLAELSRTVVVPVAPDTRQFNDFAPRTGWRAGLARWLDQALRWAQRQANSAEAIHAWPFEGVCHTLCHLSQRSWEAAARQAWEEQNQALRANILEAVHHDPGRQVLVAVQCQRIHWLEPRLKKLPDIELVSIRKMLN
jgi:hypothetical protein